MAMRSRRSRMDEVGIHWLMGDGKACGLRFAAKGRGAGSIDTAPLPSYCHPLLALDVVTLCRFLAGEERIQRQTRLLIAVPDFNVRKGRYRDKLLLVEGDKRSINAILGAHDVLLGEIVYRKASAIPEVGAGGARENCLYLDTGVLEGLEQRLSEVQNICLRAAVRAVKRVRIHGHDRRNVDDRSRLLLDQIGEDSGGQAGKGRDIQEDHVLQFVHA